MLKNDYETVTYKILQYFKECHDNIVRIDPEQLQKIMNNVGSEKFINVLKDLIEKGYVDERAFNIDFQNHMTVNILETSPITDDGLRYLSENSDMTRLYRLLKEVRDWLPL